MPEYESWIEYRDVPGFPGYKVGSDGTVWSCHRNRHGIGPQWSLRKTQRDRNGYCSVILHKTDGTRRLSVHRLVLEAFLGLCPPGSEACHANGCRTDNNVANLRWDTRKNNHHDKIAHGTTIRGGKVFGAKLTEADVLEIRRLVESGHRQQNVADIYGIAQTNVSLIARGKTWAWLKSPPVQTGL